MTANPRASDVMKLGSPANSSICAETVRGTGSGAFETSLLETSSFEEGQPAAGCLEAAPLGTCCFEPVLFVTRCFETGTLGTCCLEPVPEKVAAMRISLKEMTIEKTDASDREYTNLTDMRPVFR